MVLFAAELPALYEQFRTFSIFDAQYRDEAYANLARLGLSAGFYATYHVALAVALAMTCLALAAVIFRRRADEPVALFVALTLVLLGATFSGGGLEALGETHSVLRLLGNLLESLSFVSVLIFFFVFPNGRFVPRWTHWPAILLIAWAALASLAPESSVSAENWPNEVYAPVMLSLVLTGLLTQGYRYRRVSGPPERQQAKWVVFGFVVALVGYLGLVTADAALLSLRPGTVSDFVTSAVIYLCMLSIPISLAIAILRYRLWDIDIIINRTLVYGALTASVVGLYALLVGSLGTLLQARGSFPVALLSTGLIAVLFQPLRERLQRGVNRLMYGERDEPYGVLSRLGRRLEATMEPDAVLPTIVETVAGALKLPHAEISVKRENGFETAAAHGSPAGEPTVLPLVYAGETIGRLVLSPRVPGEPFTPSDRRLLEDLARGAEAAVHAVSLTADLQRSRERLVTTREEERLRLRRDLHDGLGPQLTGLSFGLDAARNLLLAREQEEVDALLARLKGQTREAVSDVRRLVYGLRPPALDQLGLVGAIREGAANHGRLAGTGVADSEEDGPVFAVEAPDGLPALPAAVEVAVYRIAQEAVTNVARHARARSCAVRLIPGAGVLELEVLDDGVGLPGERRAGVGLGSMRERAAELGGTCVVGPNPAGRGTRVLARLPLLSARKEEDGEG